MALLLSLSLAAGVGGWEGRENLAGGRE